MRSLPCSTKRTRFLHRFVSFQLSIFVATGFSVSHKFPKISLKNSVISFREFPNPFQAMLPVLKPQPQWAMRKIILSAEAADYDSDNHDDGAETISSSGEKDIVTEKQDTSKPQPVTSVTPIVAAASSETKKTILSPSATSSLAAVASKKNSSYSGNNPVNLKKSSSSTSSTTTTTNAVGTVSTTSPTSRWDSFDYYQHWYPVIWECDLPINKPTQVTLFDVDYVVARDGKGGWTALQDRCPHKAAALSEGRITSSGFLQCAYHGWSFDGTTGDCMQIPQAATTASSKSQGGGVSARACAKAIPLQVHQGMVWLWPGPVQETYPTPPTVPEMDLPGWTSIPVIRDFPCVDWSLLVSNILDPDHGCFAHTQLAFDLYSADSEHPLQIQENFDNAGWTLDSQVNAVNKILEVDRNKRKALGIKTKEKKEPTEDLQATSWFAAPTTISLSRRNAKGESKFITAFWVTPVGTGRSRFMTAAVSNTFPFKVPRWIFTISLNRFLDQDTVLVASQQAPLLTAEAEGVEKPRASLFAYGSATDKTVRLIDQFWDATLHKAPNRKLTLQQLYKSGRLQHTLPREQVLDRKVQNLDICPDSQGFVRKCRALRNTSVGVVAVYLIQVLWQRALPNRGRWLPLLATSMAYLTHQLQRQFYFVKTKVSRDKDLTQIPIKAWLDP